MKNHKKSLLIITLILSTIILTAIATSQAEVKTYRLNLNPFYRSQLNQATPYQYTINIDTPDGIRKIESAILNIETFTDKDTTITINVNGQSCNPPSFLIEKKYNAEAQALLNYDCSNIINKKGNYNITLTSNVQTGATYAWMDITYINNPQGTLELFGTEYQVGDRATAFLQIKNDQSQPVNNAVCYLDAFYPETINATHPIWLTKAPMLFKNGSDGIYFYDVTMPNITGVYLLSASCKYEQGGGFIYGTDDTETNFPNRTSIQGSFFGSEIFINAYDDWIYTACSSSGGTIKSCEANYDYNTTINFPLGNFSQLDLFYMGEADKTATIKFSFFNWNTSQFQQLPNTLTFSGLTSGAPIGIGDFASNSLPLTSYNTTNGLIRIKINVTSGASFNLWNNWLNIKGTSAFGNVQELKGSGEFHVTNYVNQIMQAIQANNTALLQNITSQLNLSTNQILNAINNSLNITTTQHAELTTILNQIQNNQTYLINVTETNQNWLINIWNYITTTITNFLNQINTTTTQNQNLLYILINQTNQTLFANAILFTTDSCITGSQWTIQSQVFDQNNNQLIYPNSQCQITTTIDNTTNNMSWNGEAFTHTQTCPTASSWNFTIDCN